MKTHAKQAKAFISTVPLVRDIVFHEMDQQRAFSATLRLTDLDDFITPSQVIYWLSKQSRVYDYKHREKEVIWEVTRLEWEDNRQVTCKTLCFRQHKLLTKHTMEPPPPSPSSTEASPPVTTGSSSPNVAIGGSEKTKQEKLKELYEELEKLQSSFPTEDSVEPGARYPNHWNEDDWEKDFESHPIFMSKAPENPEDMPAMVEAMRQLKYDEQFNTKSELAFNYKKDGNENFRLKKYRWAIDSFTAGIKQQCEDNALNSQLYGNRAASHFRLGNYRSAVKDSMIAIKLNPDNKKAGLRVAESLFLLKDYRECVDYCKKHIKQYPELEDFLLKCLHELQLLEIAIREKQAAERTVENKKNKILQIVKERGIKFTGNIFESNHPAAANYQVDCSLDGDLEWPVIFVYPEVGQTDFVPNMSENAKLEEQLELLLGDPANRPAWDREGKYIPQNLKVCIFDSKSGLMIAIDPKEKLRDILASPQFTLVGANPVFAIVSKWCFSRPNIPNWNLVVANIYYNNILLIATCVLFFSSLIQACIKPLETPKEGDGGSKKRVQVSLTDCLACSGCVTSAETVLINQQSHQEFIKVLETKQSAQNGTIVAVVSLSHQAIASFAAKYFLSFQESALKLLSFFKSLGVDYIFDLTLARHLCLIEESREFEEKLVKTEDGTKGTTLSSVSKNPILSTVCPGWVCYAEKTHGNLVPLLSQVKSPQQVMGSLIKTIWRKKNPNIPSDARIYHATIMPCFDKKLEASRSYFIDEKTKEADVDTVLTPIELEQLLLEKGINFSDMEVMPDVEIDKIFPSVNGFHDEETNEILSHDGSGSGAHAENVILTVVQRLLKNDVTVSPSDLVMETKKNKDFVEVHVSCKSSDKQKDDPKIRFAIVNGFRNIQTLVQKIKRNKCEYDFVEVMACPSGCLNGGAQLRPSTGPTTLSGQGSSSLDDKVPTQKKDTGIIRHPTSSEAYSDRIKRLYESLKKTSVSLDYENSVVNSLYRELFDGDEDMRRRIFYTEFKAVPKTTNLLTMTW